MTFQSILFPATEDLAKRETPQAPDFFGDLNLDQVIDVITAGKDEYNLKPLFYTSLHDIHTIDYRHGVLRDLENGLLSEHISSFAKQMRSVREHLAQSAKLYHQHQKQSWFLDALEIYCDTLGKLVHDLSLVDLRSAGLLAFRSYLLDYMKSESFTSLLAETKGLKADLATSSIASL